MGAQADGMAAVRARVRTTLAAITAGSGGPIANLDWDGGGNAEARAGERRAEGYFRMGDRFRRVIGGTGRAISIPGVCYVNLLDPTQGGAGKIMKAADEFAEAFRGSNFAVENVRYRDASWDYRGRVRGSGGSGTRADGDAGGYHLIQVMIPFTLYVDG